jgi:hypothetical protein
MTNSITINSIKNKGGYLINTYAQHQSSLGATTTIGSNVTLLTFIGTFTNNSALGNYTNDMSMNGKKIYNPRSSFYLLTNQSENQLNQTNQCTIAFVTYFKCVNTTQFVINARSAYNGATGKIALQAFYVDATQSDLKLYISNHSNPMTTRLQNNTAYIIMINIKYNSTTSNSPATLRINGNVVSTLTYNIGSTLYSKALDLGSFNTNTSSQVNAAGFAEYQYYTTMLTDAENQTVEGYLAWKWGMQTSLPANHPYRNSSPTT